MTVRSVEIYAGSGYDWDAFVDSRPDATAYHRFRWKRVVEESFGHDGFYLAARNRMRDIVGILPLFHMKSRSFRELSRVARPSSTTGGLLLFGG